MAKKAVSKKRKSAPKAKKYAGKTRNEWRDLGEQFGKRIDSESKSFSKAFEDMGRKMERQGDAMETYWRSWWFDAMGLVGPLVKSVLGMAAFVLGVIILNFFNSFVANGFVSII